MSNDRLLTDAELKEATGKELTYVFKFFVLGEVRDASAAQDAKTAAVMQEGIDQANIYYEASAEEARVAIHELDAAKEELHFEQLACGLVITELANTCKELDALRTKGQALIEASEAYQMAAGRQYACMAGPPSNRNYLMEANTQLAEANRLWGAALAAWNDMNDSIISPDSTHETGRKDD